MKPRKLTFEVNYKKTQISALSGAVRRKSHLVVVVMLLLSELVGVSGRGELVQGPSDDQTSSDSRPASKTRQEARDETSSSAPSSIMVQDHGDVDTTNDKSGMGLYLSRPILKEN